MSGSNRRRSKGMYRSKRRMSKSMSRSRRRRSKSMSRSRLCPHHDSSIECEAEDDPVPDCLEGAVVE